MQDYTLDMSKVKEEEKRFIIKVYNWMSFALFLTAVTALLTVKSEALSSIIFGSRFTMWGLLIAEFGLVIFISSAINKIHASTAILLFIIYSVLNGLTFSVILKVFAKADIALAFFITAGTFATMSIYGYTTKKDLTSMGSLLFMGLIGVVIASVVNMFLHSTTLYWIISYAGVLVFVGLTAFDTQKIKNMNILGNEGTEEDTKEAVLGALVLYLDFINLFLFILRIVGGNRD